MFIVELERGVWIAPWSGDPGRTVVRENAKTFKTIESAKKALTAAREYRAFGRAQIEKEEIGDREELVMGVML